MGNNKSHLKAKEQVVVQSTGTHIFELHMPTMGFSVATLLFFLVILGGIWMCIRACRQHGSRPLQQQQAFSMPLMNPVLASQMLWQQQQHMALQMPQPAFRSSRITEVPQSSSRITEVPQTEQPTVTPMTVAPHDPDGISNTHVVRASDIY